MNAFENFVHEVIRPLKASDCRKARIREELLSHLNQAKAARETKGMPSECLEDETIRHFGSPAEIRQRIQESVPKMERLMCLRLLDRREGETDRRYAARCTGWATVLILVQLVLVVGWIHWAGYSRRVPSAQGLAVIISTLALVAAFVYAAMLWGMRNQRLFHARRTTLAVTETVVFSSVIGLMSFAVCVVVCHVIPALAVHLVSFGLLCLAGAALLTAVMVAAAQFTVRNQPWIEPGRDIC